eukprot:COSAG01_NODE_2886_length_6891_cov_26.917780_9_plen_170_part_00
MGRPLVLTFSRLLPHSMTPITPRSTTGGEALPCAARTARADQGESTQPGRGGSDAAQSPTGDGGTAEMEEDESIGSTEGGSDSSMMGTRLQAVVGELHRILNGWVRNVLRSSSTGRARAPEQPRLEGKRGSADAPCAHIYLSHLCVIGMSTGVLDGLRFTCVWEAGWPP